MPFQPGNQEYKKRATNGPRPLPEQMQYVRATHREVTVSRWRKIMAQAYEDALDPNWRIRDAARRFLAPHVLGLPVQRSVVLQGKMSARQQEILEYMAELYRSMIEVESDDTPSNAAST